MIDKSFSQICILIVIFIFVACGQKSGTEANELINKIAELEKQVNQLQAEKEKSESKPAESLSSGQQIVPSAEQTPSSPVAPSYYFGEILTKNGNRIKVEQFGKQAGDAFSSYKIKGIYKDQKVEIEWKDIRRIWITGPIYHYDGGPSFPDSVELEMTDDRHFKIQYKELVPSGSVPYITVNDITQERSLQYTSLSNLIVIAINGKLESLNYCPNCKKYYPDIYKYCNKCGGELHYQSVP